MPLLLFASLLSAGLVAFVARALATFRAVAHVPRTPAPPASDAPGVTLFVPARDEERSIERCVRSLLAQDYPRDRVRVVVLDDRSTDATPTILARLAERDERLRVLRGSDPPAGWVGKCWALHQASAHAGPAARYFLFTDADTIHDPGMLSAAVGFAEAQGADLLSLGPRQELQSLAERLLLPGILGAAMTSHGTAAQVNDPRRPDLAKAIGQFLLFRAEAYHAIGGHESVHDEIVEDFALARRIKGTGHRLVLADGRDLVQTRMYHSAREIWDGFSKNAYNEARQGPGGAYGALVVLLAVVLGPWLLAWEGLRRTRREGGVRDRLLLWNGLLQIGATLLLGRATARWFGLSSWYALGQPLSGLFLWGILANSTWRTRSGRGVVWKGRTY